MPHDEQLGILVQSSDEDAGTVDFHFIHTDGDGKERHSPHYRGHKPEEVYGAQAALIDLWLTRQEVNNLRKTIRVDARAERLT